MLTKGPRGTNDFLPNEIEKWQFVEEIIRDLCTQYGYREIRTPIFEHTELFLRGVGDTTDIVEKEMYTFEDRGERSLTLRPEGTAPTVRAFLQHKLYADAQPIKLYYIGPMFRYDRPQAGRYRQFHQFGIELFGTNHPSSDAEVISVAMEFYQRLGLKGLEVKLNSVGCPQCRQDHKAQLQEYLQVKMSELCSNCQGRFDRNPMRILDCKSENCSELVADAPTTTRCLCSQCSSHFEDVKKYLDLLEISYTVDEKLVRGLDYYTNTAFEIVYQGIGAQSSIGGGGRYNGLVEQMGGNPVPAIGFGLGLERLLLSLEHQNIEIPTKVTCEAYIVTLGEKAEATGVKILNDMRKQGIRGDKDYTGKSFKGQLKLADKKGAKYAIIIGDNELEKGKVTIKNMGTGDQDNIKIDNLISFLIQAREEE
ncbi:histidyl-tRNA synthetase [Desulfitispora alkaliphila]|uniref:histidine--tRNA ligase n=1 Tax=Desulfitispora alkaliphila TaxID=622674 RepID=UPI003D1CF72B